MDISDLDGCLAAASAGELGTWLTEFLLHGANPNPALAEELALGPDRLFLDPVPVPLDRVRRTTGPDAGDLLAVDPDLWEAKVAMLATAVQSGWNPQPLLVMSLTPDTMLVRDGNYRLEALRRAGRGVHHVIFLFPDGDGAGDLVGPADLGRST